MARKIQLEIGQRFGRLTVVAELPRVKTGSGGIHRTIECMCECGNKTVATLNNLRRNHTASCGCLHVDIRRKHGWARTALYKVWAGMKDRCYNPDSKVYSYYGGRGIGMSYVFYHSFKAFLDHMGERPSPELTIDRIDNDGDYESGNLRWATRHEQSMNQRRRMKPCSVKE